MLHHIKSLMFQPVKLFFSGIVEIHIFCTYQGKCIEFYVSLCRDLVVQLADRTTAQIPWIFIFCIHVINFFIDPLKIFVTDHCFPSQDQFPFIRNMKRHVFKYFRIVGNDLTDFPISSCNCLKKFAVTIGQNDRQTIHLP